MIEFASMDSTHFTKLNKNPPEKKCFVLCLFSGLAGWEERLKISDRAHLGKRSFAWPTCLNICSYDGYI